MSEYGVTPPTLYTITPLNFRFWKIWELKYLALLPTPSYMDIFGSDAWSEPVAFPAI